MADFPTQNHVHHAVARALRTGSNSSGTYRLDERRRPLPTELVTLILHDAGCKKPHPSRALPASWPEAMTRTSQASNLEFRRANPDLIK